MNPTVEVLPPEETPTQIMLATVPVPTVAAGPTQGKKPVLLEKDMHRAMLAYYFTLGQGRTLSKVAEHFGKTQAMIEKFSHVFGWKKRIAELENRSKADLFKDKIGELLLLLLDSLTKPDEKTGAPALTSSAKTTAEVVKLCTNSFKELRQDAREEEPQENSGRGPGNRTGPNHPVMFNVIFKGM